MFKKPILGIIFISVFCAVLRPDNTGKLIGLITDSKGEPIDDAKVVVISSRTSSISYHLTTNKEGRFFQVGIAPGYYQMNINKKGFMPKSLEARVRLADETNLTIVLDKAGEILLKNVSAADKAFLKGNSLYKQQNYAEAAVAYEEAIKTDAMNWSYFFNLGLAYKKANNREQALKAFRNAVELNPESYSGNKEIGEALAAEGAFDEARTYYRKAVELSPDDAEARFNLGACLTNTGDNEAALIEFQKATELDPNQADAYYQIGTLLIGRNDVPGAIDNLQKFLSLAPDHEKAPLARQLLDYLKK